MTHAPPLLWTWNEDAMTMPPRPAFLAEARRQFVDGGIYRLGEIEQRSDVSHSHQFAWLREAWRNLPEHYAQEFASPDALRRYALIKAGFYNETILDVGSNAVAIRVAQAMRALDSFSYIAVRDCFVIRREAKSQKKSEMDREEFQASKTAIMEIISAMIEVTPGQLSENAGKAA